jgi:hypothetical protein
LKQAVHEIDKLRIYKIQHNIKITIKKTQKKIKNKKAEEMK